VTQTAVFYLRNTKTGDRRAYVPNGPAFHEDRPCLCRRRLLTRSRGGISSCAGLQVSRAVSPEGRCGGAEPTREETVHLGADAQSLKQKEASMLKKSVAVCAMLTACLYGGTLVPQLDSIIQNAPPDTLISVMATTTLQADLSTLPVDSSAPRAVIYDQKIAFLQQVAQEAQAELLGYLGSQQSVTNVQTFWLVSRVAFEATPAVIVATAQRDDVEYVTDDFTVYIPQPGETELPESATWNIAKVHADACWTRGVTGAGVVVGTIDSGVEDEHVAFHGRWRSSNGWHDAVCHRNTPYDDTYPDDHGTGVMGIICGGDGLGPDPNDIGVAPGATFIAARAFCRFEGKSSWVHECFQWMADPGRPDVLNNSWSNTNRTSLEFWADVNNMRALGITCVFVVGNNGDSPSTSNTPGNFPTVIGVGATDVNDNIASFSARGPAPNQAPWTDDAYWPRPDWNRINPSISAPGVGVKSARGFEFGHELDQYTEGLDGTSYAAPHVTGCIALLLQNLGKYPNLPDPDEVFNIVTGTADHPSQGGSYPNNNYGWGRLNCLMPTIVGAGAMISPNQAKHIARRPGTQQVYVVYWSAGYVNVNSSNDNGVTWSGSERVALGKDPCISLDWRGTPWIVYVRDHNLYCSIRRSNGWHEWTLYDGSTLEAKDPSFVCSNWSNDAVPWPPPQCDMGYVAFLTESPSAQEQVRCQQVRFIAFDTLHSENGMYNYGIDYVQWNLGRYSMPCISRTPGDFVHVTWRTYDANQDWRSVVYSTASMNPASIRGNVISPFSPSVEIDEWAVQGNYPSNDAYSDYVTGVWRAGNDVGTVKKNRRNVYSGYDQWTDFGQWSEGQGEAGTPAMNRCAALWRQEFSTGIGDIVCRFVGESDPTRLTYGGANRAWPQADVKVATQSGYDTLRTIWGQSIGWCNVVCYEQFLHNHQGGYEFYSIACGQPEPSPYCTQRDSWCASTYPFDIGLSTLAYHLSYLDPLRRYRVHAIVFHTGSVPLAEQFEFPIDDTTAVPGPVVNVPPGVPTEVWFDVPPQLHRDAVTDLVIRKVAGGYAAAASIELCESEPVDTSGGGGGQTADKIPLRLPLAVLGVIPNPFSHTATIRYQTLSPEPVCARMLDVSGRCVRLLGPAEACAASTGQHAFAWDGLDARGRELPVGVYFCRLEQGGERSTVKLCLTR